MTPYRNRDYLDLSYVEDGQKPCIRCGKRGCEPAHYSGLYSDQLGKGGGQKAFDVAADLCRECHRYFDLYVDGNDDRRAAEFMLLILLTLRRNLEMGYAELLASVRIRPETGTPVPKLGPRRKQDRRTLPGRKHYPRGRL